MNLLEDLGRQFFYSLGTSPAANKYHGLKNRGATCYLNSVLQVLFMTKDFRQAVKRYTCKNPDTDCIDCHLKTLFDDLEGEGDTAHTYNITKKLGIDRVYEQQDAAEYFEKILSLTSPEASQIFHGELRHENKCVCGEETNTDGPFWHLPLALVDSSSEDYSVVDGIEKFFSTSEVSGENQMYCEKCGKKADATLKSVMKHHPDVLMLLLKRFEFDYSYMAYVKINRVVDVPLTLQIPENQIYELYAVVDHFGDLRSGHYTATIKSDDDDSWYKFNDANVSKLHHQPFQVDNTEKSQSAYLLFYMKKKMDAADTCTQDTREMPTPEGLQLDISDNDKQLQDAVKIRETHEGGEEAEVSNDTAEAVSIDRYKGKESSDMDSFGSTGVEMMRDDAEDVGGKTGADDQAVRRDMFSVKTHTDENIDDQNNDNEGLDCVTHKAVEERREINDEGDKEGKTGDDKLASGSLKLLIRYDLCKYPEDQNKRGVSDAKLNMPKGDQGCKQGISSVLYESPERQREEMKGVSGDMEQVRGDDEHRRGTSMSKYDSDEDVEDQDNERLDAVSRIIYEDQERKQKSGQDYGLECVGVVRQGDEEVIKIKVKKDKGHQKISNTLRHVYSRQVFVDKQREEKRDGKEDKKQKRGDDEHTQRRATSVLYCGEGVEDQNRRQERLEQESRYKDEEENKEHNEHTESSKRLTENQRKRIRSCDTQPDVRSGSYSVTENMMEGRNCPKEKKVNRTDSDDQSSSKTRKDKTMKTEMEDKTSRGSKKSRNVEVNFERKCNPKTDTLTKSVHSLSLSESPELEKYQRRKTKEGVRKRKWWHLKRLVKSHRKKKKKQEKTPECLMCLPLKNADQMSD